MNPLHDIFAQGDADLRTTAGEPATLIRRRSGERIPITVVVSPAEVAIDLPTTSGAVITCDRTVLISREQVTRQPLPGDTLEMGRSTFEILRCTGWAYDTSWHADIGLRRK